MFTVRSGSSRSRLDVTPAKSWDRIAGSAMTGLTTATISRVRVQSGQVTTHERARTPAMTLSGLNAVPPSPRIHALCIGGEEPHGADAGISAGSLDRSD